jgi:hypothetical protein
VGTEGTLSVEGRRSATFVLWADTAPRPVEIEVLATDGMIRVYNVWDSGRGLGSFESQSATSGMLASELPDGSRRYRCADIGPGPGFDRLAFRVQVVNDAKGVDCDGPGT